MFLELYEAELQRKRRAEDEADSAATSSDSVVTSAGAEDEGGGGGYEPLDTERFINKFLDINQERENELHHLRQRLQGLQRDNQSLCDQLVELRVRGN